MNKTVYMISTMFYPSIGGVENHIYFISKYLVNNGYEVKIIKPSIGEETKVSLLDNIEVHTVGIGTKDEKVKYDKYKERSKGSNLGFLYGYLRKNYFNKFYKEVYSYIENNIKNGNNNEVIIHQHDFISSIRLSKRLSKKYNIIFTNHTGEFLFLKKLPFSNTIIKQLTKHFSYIIVPSDELAAFNGIRDKKTFKYIPNGVDMELFSQKSNDEINEIKGKYNINEEKIIVLCPRRWAPTKGIIYLIKAIKLLKDRSLDDKAQFIFVGNDYSDYEEYAEEIRKYISDNEIGKNIKLMGNIDSKKMSEVIACTNIVVLPSLMEAVSLSALEAMACSKIILSTNVGGFPQIIENNINGIMVNPASEQELAEELEKLLTNIDGYKKMGINAYEFVKGKYSWNNIGERTEEVYNNFTNKIGDI